MQVKSVAEKRVAIVRAAMIVARNNYWSTNHPHMAHANFDLEKTLLEDRRAVKILTDAFGCSYVKAKMFLAQIIIGKITVRRILDTNLSEVPYV